MPAASFHWHTTSQKLAKKVGMQLATLRNKLNPVQSHQLTLPKLLAIIDLTEDPTILDGFLRQLNCQPSVPVKNARPENMQFCALTAVASVGVIAGEPRHDHCRQPGACENRGAGKSGQ